MRRERVARMRNTERRRRGTRRGKRGGRKGLEPKMRADQERKKRRMTKRTRLKRGGRGRGRQGSLRPGTPKSSPHPSSSVPLPLTLGLVARSLQGRVGSVPQCVVPPDSRDSQAHRTAGGRGGGAEEKGRTGRKESQATRGGESAECRGLHSRGETESSGGRTRKGPTRRWGFPGQDEEQRFSRPRVCTPLFSRGETGVRVGGCGVGSKGGRRRCKVERLSELVCLCKEEGPGADPARQRSGRGTQRAQRGGLKRRNTGRTSGRTSGRTNGRGRVECVGGARVIRVTCGFGDHRKTRVHPKFSIPSHEDSIRSVEPNADFAPAGSFALAHSVASSRIHTHPLHQHTSPPLSSRRFVTECERRGRG